MLVKLIKFLFLNIIGDLPKEQKRELWNKLNEVLELAVRSAAEGAVRGAVNK